MVTVINDKQRMIDESTRAGRGIGSGIGGMLGAFGSRFFGKPSLDGLRAEHSQSPQLVGRKSTLATYQYHPRQNYGPSLYLYYKRNGDEGRSAVSFLGWRRLRKRLGSGKY